MTGKVSQLFLSTSFADVLDSANTCGDFTFRNINFKTILGENFELNGLYNIVLTNELRGPPGTLSTANRMQYYLMSSGAMEFYHYRYINGVFSREIGGMVGPMGPYTLANPIHTSFGDTFICTFRLTNEIGDIQIRAININSTTTTLQGYQGRHLAFDIMKINK
jgi:hypothetical protein